MKYFTNGWIKIMIILKSAASFAAGWCKRFGADLLCRWQEMSFELPQMGIIAPYPTMRLETIRCWQLSNLKHQPGGCREEAGIGVIVGIDVEHALPCGLDTLDRHWDELEHKSLYATPCLKHEISGIDFSYYVLVEVAYQCGQQKEYSVFGHERFWQPVLLEHVVLVV